MIEVDLPYPPSVNHLYRRTKRGVIVRKEVKQFWHEVYLTLLTAKVRPLEGPLAVEVGLYPADKITRDIDNPLKSLLDGLQHAGAFEDDSQVVRLQVAFMGHSSPGKCHVKVYRLEDA